MYRQPQVVSQEIMGRSWLQWILGLGMAPKEFLIQS
jgi:hypothetical protein